jgi:hypothetical protein
MLGLPKATEMNRLLPKKTIYEKFKLNTVERQRFDGDIRRLATQEAKRRKAEMEGG